MLRHGYFLLCLLLVSLGTVGTLHARELPGSQGIECTGRLAAADAGEGGTGSDDDKAALHHHSDCTGASSLFVPVTAIIVLPETSLPDALTPAPVPEPAGWQPIPAIRPPIA
jgi:hypothetical protein